MADVTIYGVSDDLIEVEGDVPGCDEYNGENATLLLVGDEGALRVTVRFDEHGNWMVGVAPRDEDTKMLPVVVGQEPRMDGEGFGYSARVVASGVNVVTYERGDEAPED